MKPNLTECIEYLKAASDNLESAYTCLEKCESEAEVFPDAKEVVSKSLDKIIDTLIRKLRKVN